MLIVFFAKIINICNKIILFCVSEIFPQKKNSRKNNYVTLLQEFIQKNHSLLPYHYKSPIIRRSIWLLKYKGHSSIADIYAQVLSEELFETVIDLFWWNNIQTICLIPIPNSKERRLERGWNQTELVVFKLHDYISMNTLKINTNTLIKKQNTVSQTKFKRHERLQNIKNSFHIINPSDITNSTIIIFDDVMTTGSTLKEASNVLYAGGAHKIISITLAH